MVTAKLVDELRDRQFCTRVYSTNCMIPPKTEKLKRRRLVPINDRLP